MLSSINIAVFSTFFVNKGDIYKIIDTLDIMASGYVIKGHIAE